MFLFLFIINKAKNQTKNRRKFPYIPVLKNKCKNGNPCIVNYFDFENMDHSSSSFRVFKDCIKSSVKGEKSRVCIKRLNSYYKEKNSDAAYILGMINEYGLLEMPMNDTAARKYFEVSAEQGHTEALAELGFMLRYGFGGERDIERSIFLTQTSMQQGSIQATLSSSFMYRYGLNMPQSCSTAYSKLHYIVNIAMKTLPFTRKTNNPGVTRFFKNSLPKNDNTKVESINGYNKAKYSNDKFEEKFNKAINYLYSEEKNESLGIKILKELKSEGYAKAYSMLGICYRDGIGVNIDNETAMDYFYIGSKKGNALSTFSLGEMQYESSNLTVKESGFVYINKALQQGLIDSIYYTGKHAIYNEMFFSPYFNQSIQFINISSILGYLPAIFTFGNLYAKGFIKDVDCEEGFRLVMLSAELSPLFDDSQHAYISLKNNDKNYSLRIYQKLADWGSEAAMWNSQQLCENLKLDSSDWFELQVKMGYHLAVKEFAKKKLKDGDIEGVSYLKKAAVTDSQAAFDLAILYFRKGQLKEGLKYLEKSKSLKKSAIISCTLNQIFIYILYFPKGLLAICFNHECEEKHMVINTWEKYKSLIIFCCTFSLFWCLTKYKLYLIIRNDNFVRY